MDTNKIASGMYEYNSTYRVPKTVTKKTTTTKKKFDKEGLIVSETTTVVEESTTTYDSAPWYITNTSSAGEVTYK